MAEDPSQSCVLSCCGSGAGQNGGCVEPSADVSNKSVSNTCVIAWTSEGTDAVMLCKLSGVCDPEFARWQGLVNDAQPVWFSYGTTLSWHGTPLTRGALFYLSQLLFL